MSHSVVSIHYQQAKSHKCWRKSTVSLTQTSKRTEGSAAITISRFAKPRLEDVLHGLHLGQKNPNGGFWNPPTLERNTCWWMGSPIVTITKVTFSQARWMVEAPGAVAEELLCEYRMVAMAVFLGETFLGDGALLDRLLHHLLGKD
jgi:hypothetical protein